MRLYEFAVIKSEKRDKDGELTLAAKVVVPITPLLARDDDQAKLLAARAIPEEDIAGIDDLTVVVRPF